MLQELADEKAEFCLVTGIAPSEYDRLTIAETKAFSETYNRLKDRK